MAITAILVCWGTPDNQPCQWILRWVFRTAKKLLWIGTPRGLVPLEKIKAANLKSMNLMSTNYPLVI